MTKGVEHVFFMCLLAIPMTSFVKHIFKSVAHLKNGLLVFLLLSCKNPLNVLNRL